jgi:hypothetical protein
MNGNDLSQLSARIPALYRTLSFFPDRATITAGTGHMLPAFDALSASPGGHRYRRDGGSNCRAPALSTLSGVILAFGRRIASACIARSLSFALLVLRLLVPPPEPIPDVQSGSHRRLLVKLDLFVCLVKVVRSAVELGWCFHSHARPILRNPCEGVRSFGEESNDGSFWGDCLPDVRPWSVCCASRRTLRASVEMGVCLDHRPGNRGGVREHPVPEGTRRGTGAFARVMTCWLLCRRDPPTASCASSPA